MDVEAVAKRLTDSQKRIVLSMAPGEFHDAYKLCRQRRTRMKLTNSGITEPSKDGPVTSYWSIRLSERGLAVREYLEKQNGSD